MKKMNEAKKWEDRLQLAFKSYEGQAVDEKILKDGLYTLKTHLENIMSFKPTNDLVSGQIHLIRPTGSSQYDNCGLVAVNN